MTAIDPRKIITYRAWWPASVLLPGKVILHRVRAYATSMGLLVYVSIPRVASMEWGDQEPDWWSPIDYEATVRPNAAMLPGGHADIQTASGLVVVTYTGGCGCGMPLKRWRPSFSTNVAIWPEKVSA